MVVSFHTHEKDQKCIQPLPENMKVRYLLDDLDQGWANFLAEGPDYGLQVFCWVGNSQRNIF
jgi:hypothetical protein